jgi:hypothetical protein
MLLSGALIMPWRLLFTIVISGGGHVFEMSVNRLLWKIKWVLDFFNSKDSCMVVLYNAVKIFWGARNLPILVYYPCNDHFDFNICLFPFIFYHFLIYCQFEHFLRSTWIRFNVTVIIVTLTSFVSTFCYCCKHFGIPKMFTFTWCTLNMVQWLAWCWLYGSKHVATFIIDNKLVVFWLEFILSNLCTKLSPACFGWHSFRPQGDFLIQEYIKYKCG